jgi:DNA polymerase delta subunit 1
LRLNFEKEIVLYKKRSGIFSEVSYESGLPFNMRFMVDNKINGMSWIKIPKGTYQMRSDEDKVSTCQIEFDVIDYRNISEIKGKEGSELAPLRILSFDIECSTDGIKFPIPTKDPVI